MLQSRTEKWIHPSICTFSSSWKTLARFHLFADQSRAITHCCAQIIQVRHWFKLHDTGWNSWFSSNWMTGSSELGLFTSLQSTKSWNLCHKIPLSEPVDNYYYPEQLKIKLRACLSYLVILNFNLFEINLLDWRDYLGQNLSCLWKAMPSYSHQSPELSFLLLFNALQYAD